MNEKGEGWVRQIIFLIFFFSWGVILARSFDLMVIKKDYYSLMAKENRIKEEKVVSPRGKIFSREGKVLAEDRVSWRNKKGDWLDKEVMLKNKIEGKEVDQVLLRVYPLGEAAAHLTGYLGEVNSQEVGRWRCPEKRIRYRLGDWVGRGGLEKEYDCYLSGREGRKLVELDARGRLVREIGEVKPEKGKDLATTIDYSLQKEVFSLIKGKKAAALVLEAETGEILALASSPSFDPNLFGIKTDEAKIRQWLADEKGLPLVDRGVSMAYHPGSVFKMITAVAGLEEGKINRETKVEDVGVIKIGDWQFGNWYWLEYGRKEGEVDLVRALKRSNDIYFYKVGEWLGAEKLAQWAKKFSWGETVGIDLPGEASGLVPSPQWKEETKKEKWFLGNTYHFAIGQGDLTATPLQVALATGVIANGGRLCQPHLKKDLPPHCRPLEIKKEFLELVKKGMVAACSPGGTGFPFFNFHPPGVAADWRVACKTGTAEVGDGSGDAHAWFTLFIPEGKGKGKVVTVLVERGGSGAYVAAPIAKEIVSFMMVND